MPERPPLSSFEVQRPPLSSFEASEPPEQSLLESVGESAGKAAKAFPGSVKQAGEDLWNLVMHGDKVIAHMREKGFSGVASEFKDDILEHYGSLEKAKHTFETDPFRFLTDVSLPLTAGGGIAAKGAQLGTRLGRAAIPRVAGLTTGVPAEAFRVAGEAGRAGGPEAALFRAGQTGQLPAGTRAGELASPEFKAGEQLAAGRPSSGDPIKDLTRLVTRGTLGGIGATAMHAAGIPPWASLPVELAATSPRLMGGAAYGLGAAERGLGGSAGTFGRAAAGAAIQQPRELLQQQAQAALKDPEFKKGKDQEQLKPLRKVTRDPNADSKAMQAAQRVLGGYRPLKLTVTPEEGAYGGTSGDVPSRQEGGPVTAGRAYSVGDAPGATPDTPKPELFIPDRGPSPAQAAGGAATEAMGWVSDAWASILKGEKPPPLPGLPEAGKVPSTADPRPTQALGEETSFLSQFAGPPGAAAAKVGLAGAGLGAAARQVGTWGGERVMSELGSGLKGIAQYLTPEELGQVTSRNAGSLLAAFKGMPSADEMAAVAYSGRAKRGWYQQSAQALRDTFGDADAPRFASLLAALSPQTSVQSNTENALRTWMNWTNAGRPTNEAAIRKILAGSVQGEKGEESVLEAWIGNSVRALQATDPTKVRLSGPKVNSFMLNLRDHVHEVTNDAWIARYAGVPQEKFASAYRKDPEYGSKTGFKSPGYMAMSAATRRAAERLTELTGDTWTPAEIQETIWSWAKTVREKVYGGSGVKGTGGTVADLLKAGNISHSEIADTPDFALLFTRGVFRNILEQAGYGETIKRVEAELGKAGARGRAAPGGTPTRVEGGPFAQPAFERHLQRAGRRLETIEE